MCPHSGASTPVVVTGHCNSFFLLSAQHAWLSFAVSYKKGAKRKKTEASAFVFYSYFFKLVQPSFPPVAAGKRWPEQEEAEDAWMDFCDGCAKPTLFE